MIGRKLGNRYEVIERIGGGGMAVVYRALDTLLNRSVSIKVLRAQFSTDDDFVRRFRREAQAAASLSHPNVVNIYDVGVEDTEEYYIVMEYVDGMTLKEVIQQRAPLPVSEAIDIAKQICAALGHAHENNIVHRDIKPHNILIGKDGRVKVTDFGIARAITSNTITQDGSVLGSVHYFSPEQARGGITDVKSDIYSLGVVLYEMVTGELPFSGETPISVALKHLQDHFVEPRQINPALPQSVENIVLKALTKDPLVRYQSAREMYRDLEKALLYPNVPKFTPPKFDEDKTIQMPAVSLRDADPMPSRLNRPANDMSAQVTQSTQVAQPPEEANKPEEEGKKGRSFWRPVIWLLVVFVLLGVGAVTAYSLVTNYMSEKDVQMPKVEGLKYEEAVQKLVEAGLDADNIQRQDETSKDVAAGIVTKQDPYAEKTIKANRPVTLTVSSGAEKVEMPNVTKMTRSEAIKAIENIGIVGSNITIEEKEDREATAGTVISQNPAAEVTIDLNTKVTLTLAKGIPKVKMPALKNFPLEDAKKRLTDLGLKVGQVITSADAEVEKGRVIKSSPFEPGSDVEKGDTVDLFVSSGPAEKKEEEPATPGDQEQTGDVARKVTAGVKVDVKAGEKVVVKLVRNDAIGSNDIVNETITESKTYQVTCTVKKDQIASIDVYQNGTKTKTITVTAEGQASEQ